MTVAHASSSISIFVRAIHLGYTLAGRPAGVAGVHDRSFRAGLSRACASGAGTSIPASERLEVLEARLDSRAREPEGPQSRIDVDRPRSPSCIDLEISDCGSHAQVVTVVEDHEPAGDECLGDRKGRRAVGEPDLNHGRRPFGQQEISQDVGIGARERDPIEVAIRADRTWARFDQSSPCSPDVLEHISRRAHLRHAPILLVPWPCSPGV